ncbi:MAG: DUF177 domain-containing protein [Burkholderiales bacterium]|nr:DUF177 domain-containing protein [Burkholderiales bacterium]
MATSDLRTWRIDTRDFTGRGREESRILGGECFDRLGEDAHVVGAVEATIATVRSPRGKAGIRLSIVAALEAQCQRCMQPVRLPVATEENIEFAATVDGFADDGLDQWDTLEHDGRFDVLQLVEDVLLLALPVAPKHEQCEPQGATYAGEKVLPFAALAGWKGGR